MKCVVVFCHSLLEDQVRQVLDEVGCDHYVGVNKALVVSVNWWNSVKASSPAEKISS